MVVDNLLPGSSSGRNKKIEMTVIMFLVRYLIQIRERKR